MPVGRRSLRVRDRLGHRLQGNAACSKDAKGGDRPQRGARSRPRSPTGRIDCPGLLCGPRSLKTTPATQARGRAMTPCLARSWPRPFADLRRGGEASRAPGKAVCFAVAAASSAGRHHAIRGGVRASACSRRGRVLRRGDHLFNVTPLTPGEVTPSARPRAIHGGIWTAAIQVRTRVLPRRPRHLGLARWALRGGRVP